jgi:TniQ/Bacterial regulatory helix-turn-helix protein, lysR family
MNATRTLPIRIAPIDGEALDSWLEALAHRTHTAFGDLLSAVGLGAKTGLGTSAWIVQLGADQASVIRAATGVGKATLKTMTLDHYSGRALRIDPDIGAVSRGFPWGRARGSRFCPACLDETGGRWQLAWRLGWTFACTRHRCLLADACPECGAVQRRRTHIGDGIPHPGRCAHPATDALGRTPARCDADLSAAAVTAFDDAHPAMHAQRIVNAILDTETPAFGVYGPSPQPRINVLSDVRAVAGRALAYATPSELEAVIPADLLSAFRDADQQMTSRAGPARTDAKPGLAAPARAATAAVGVVAALRALDSPDIASAGNALRWLVTSSRERGLAVHATNIAWGKNTSPVLSGVQLTALAPMLNPSDQLRYRIGSPLPAHPVRGTARTSTMVRRIPTMLWPAWSLPLSIPNCHQRQLRPVLSTALLIVNSRLNLYEAADLIESPVEGHAVSRVLQLLEKHNQWAGIRAALIRIANYLRDHRAPINYDRRRRLDYSMLLPDTVWAQICRDTATPGARQPRARIARCVMFERLSGLPASSGPFAVDDNIFRTKVADFPQYLTPELARALDEHARDFLADQGVGGEPPVWHPPTNLLDGLDLPGPGPDAVDVTELHHVFSGITVRRNKLGVAATLAGTSLDMVRYLLETYSVPWPTGSGAAAARIGAYRTAKEALPRERFVELYQRQRMSLRDIAASVGVSRQVIGRLARDYDLCLREPGRQVGISVDRDWLYNQYVNQRRALPDLAKEAGMSTANMARWARTYAIPMRSRGSSSHSAVLAAASATDQAPEVIRPALAGVGGWKRLQRFAAAARYPTLTDAAAGLGVGQAALIAQIDRLESELDVKLLIRAERGRSMQLTDDGTRVAAVIRACERRGLMTHHTEAPPTPN